MSQYDLEIVNKLTELTRLVREGKLTAADEKIDYEPLGNGQFNPTSYSVRFEVIDDKTQLPVMVTIETPVEKKKND